MTVSQRQNCAAKIVFVENGDVIMIRESTFSHMWCDGQLPLRSTTDRRRFEYLWDLGGILLVFNTVKAL